MLPAERAVVTIDQALIRLQENAALWVYENQNIPAAPSVALRIVRANGDVDSADEVILNSLPTVATQPFL